MIETGDKSLVFIVKGETFELSQKMGKKERKWNDRELISPSCRGEQEDERHPKGSVQNMETKKRRRREED